MSFTKVSNILTTQEDIVCVHYCHSYKKSVLAEKEKEKKHIKSDNLFSNNIAEVDIGGLHWRPWTCEMCWPVNPCLVSRVPERQEDAGVHQEDVSVRHDHDVGVLQEAGVDCKHSEEQEEEDKENNKVELEEELEKIRRTRELAGELK